MILGELGKILIYVKDDGDGDNEQDGKEIRADKLYDLSRRVR